MWSMPADACVLLDTTMASRTLLKDFLKELSMKWKAFFVLAAAYIAGLISCLVLVVVVSEGAHAAKEFALWSLAGTVCVPLALQTLVDW